MSNVKQYLNLDRRLIIEMLGFGTKLPADYNTRMPMTLATGSRFSRGEVITAMIEVTTTLPHWGHRIYVACPNCGRNIPVGRLMQHTRAEVTREQARVAASQALQQAALDIDTTVRKAIVQDINTAPGERQALERRYGQVWDTTQLSADFEVRGFMAPFCVVKRRSDGAVGSVMFQHSPRFYFSFNVDEQ